MITFDDVTFAFPGGPEVLNRASLTCEPRTVTCVAGRNGAGKSTLLSLSVGQRLPLGGRILLNDGNPRDWRARRRVGYVPQHSHFPPMATVSFIVDLVLSSYPNPLASGERRELLDRFGLSARLKQRCGALSGGWARRLSIVCALIGNPTQLIMDEPTAGLDEEGRGTLLATLLEFSDAGGSVLWTTHAAADALQAGSRVALLDQGSLRDLGSLWEFAGGLDRVQVCVLTHDAVGPILGVEPMRRGLLHSFEVPRSRSIDFVDALTERGYEPHVESLTSESVLRRMLDDEGAAA